MIMHLRKTHFIQFTTICLQDKENIPEEAPKAVPLKHDTKKRSSLKGNEVLLYFVSYRFEKNTIHLVCMRQFVKLFYKISCCQEDELIQNEKSKVTPKKSEEPDVKKRPTLKEKEVHSTYTHIHTYTHTHTDTHTHTYTHTAILHCFCSFFLETSQGHQNKKKQSVFPSNLG